MKPSPSKSALVGDVRRPVATAADARRLRVTVGELGTSRAVAQIAAGNQPTVEGSELFAS